MKTKVLTGLAALTLFDIAVATAADIPRAMPVKAPVVVVPSWTGFYIGGHAGYRWADANFSSPSYVADVGGGPMTFPARNENYGLSGGIFGLQGGYNYQFNPSWLIGIEGDWSWGRGTDTQSATLTGVALDGFTFRRTSEVELTWEATIRGRLGYINGPWLLYGTGGVAFTRANWSDSSWFTAGGTTVSATWNASNTLSGWVLGGGVEYMYNPKWLVRLEYLYEQFGDFNVPHGFGPQTGKLDIGAVQKLRAGISYKFGPDPVVAKY